MKPTKFDIAFLGFGAAAIYHLIVHQESLKSKKILIIEAEPRFQTNKTLSGFYEPSLSDLESSKSYHWQAGLSGSPMIFHSATSYSVIQPKTLWKYFEEIRGGFQSLDLRFESMVQSLEEKGSGFEIKTANSIFFASQIYDSRFGERYLSDLKNDYLNQHFLGLIIESKSKNFQTTLMEIDSSFKSGLKFLYKIKLSEGLYLFELTYFSRNRFASSYYQKELEDYVQREIGPHTVLEIEQGVIPLVEVRTQFSRKNYFPLGVRGGNLRASTGYSFSRSVFLSNKNIRAEANFYHRGKWRLIQLMDRVLLEVISLYPDRSAFVFSVFFKALKGNEIASFLGPNPRISVLFKLMIKMPKALFLKGCLSLLKTHRHRVLIKDWRQ